MRTGIRTHALPPELSKGDPAFDVRRAGPIVRWHCRKSLPSRRLGFAFLRAQRDVGALIGLEPFFLPRTEIRWPAFIASENQWLTISTYLERDRFAWLR